MPGKTDAIGTIGTQPTFPGSKGFRALDEGWTARYNLQARNTNPHVVGTVEYEGWDFGWLAADGNSSGTRFMPAISGVPGPLP